MNTGLLAYTFTKFCDNLTNNDEDITIANSNSNVKYIALAAKLDLTFVIWDGFL